MKKDIITRFFEKVDKSGGPFSCWIWNGSKDENGYGRICGSFKGRPWRKNHKTHRLSFEIMYGDMILEKPCICHYCDNPSCVNPLHLWIGTHTENMQDSLKKGRYGSVGEKNKNGKLFESDVLQIKSFLSQGLKASHISKIFKVSDSAISDIKLKKTWKYLNESRK